MFNQHNTPFLIPGWRSAVVAAVIAAGLTACGGGDGNDDSGNNGDTGGTGINAPDSLQRMMLKDIGTVVAADFARLDQRMDTFDDSLEAYCAAPATDTVKQNKARQDFKSMMNVLQETIMYDFGPALEGGKLLRAYSWPLSSPCKLDLKLANDEATLATAFDQRGVDALEYLLFANPADNHSCNQNFVVANPELNRFNALAAAEKQTRRCALMAGIADDAEDRIEDITAAWNDGNNNYQQTLRNSSDVKSALNRISDGLFYFEKVLKESKLDAPLGGTLSNTAPSCGAGVICPADRESPHAALAKQNMLANMRGMQKVFFGGEPAGAANQRGFDDWLNEAGRSDLAQVMAQRMQATIDALNGLSGSLGDNLQTNPTAVSAVLNNHVQPLSQNLRFEFTQALGINLPAGAASDTD